MIEALVVGALVGAVAVARDRLLAKREQVARAELWSALDRAEDKADEANERALRAEATASSARMQARLVHDQAAAVSERVEVTHAVAARTAETVQRLRPVVHEDGPTVGLGVEPSE